MKGKASRLAILLAVVLTLVGAFGLTAFANTTSQWASDITSRSYNGTKDNVSCDFSENELTTTISYKANKLKYVPQTAGGEDRGDEAAWVGAMLIAPDETDSSKAKIGRSSSNIKDPFNESDSEAPGKVVSHEWLGLTKESVTKAVKEKNGVISYTFYCDWENDNSYDHIYKIKIDVNDLVLYDTEGNVLLETSAGKIINPVTVSFDKNAPEGVEVKGEMSDQSFYKGVAQNLNDNAFSIEIPGYTFEGWATSSTGTKDYDNKAEFTTSKDATLYAVWKQHEHSWIFKGNSGDNNNVAFLYCQEDGDNCPYKSSEVDYVHYVAKFGTVEGKDYDGQAIDASKAITLDPDKFFEGLEGVGVGYDKLTYHFKPYGKDAWEVVETATNAGTYYVTAEATLTGIEGITNTVVMKSNEFTIKPLKLTHEVSMADYYAGQTPSKPVVTVKAGDKALKEGTDYNVIDYAYKKVGEEDSQFGSTAPTTVGNYEIRARIRIVDATNYTPQGTDLWPRARFSVTGHEHDWQIKVDPEDAGTAIVYCNDENCDYNAGSYNKLVATSRVYNGEAFTWGKGDLKFEKSGVTLPSGMVVSPDTKYYKGDEKLSGAPKNAGEYTAEVEAWIKFGNERTEKHVTIRRDFEITPVEYQPTVTIDPASWKYRDENKMPTVTYPDDVPGTASAKFDVTFEVKPYHTSDYNYVVYNEETKLDAGEYTVRATIVDPSGNYAVVNPYSHTLKTHFTVNALEINISADNMTSVYKPDPAEGEEPKLPECTVSFSGKDAELITGDVEEEVMDALEIYCDAEWESPVGTYPILLDWDEENTNFDVKLSGAKYKITKRPLTLKAKDKTVVYGTVADYHGLNDLEVVAQEGENVNLAKDETIADAVTGTVNYTYGGGYGSMYSDVGEYVVRATDISSDNYSLDLDQGKITVTKKPVTLSWYYDTAEKDPIALTEDMSIPYDAKYHEIYAELTDGEVLPNDKKFVGPDYDYNSDDYGRDVKRLGNAWGNDDTEFGFYQCALEGEGLTGSRSFNYSLDAQYFESEKLTITPYETVTINVKDKTIKYGDPAANNGYTATGFIGSDTIEVIDKSGEEWNYGGYVAKTSGKGTYDLSVSGLRARNYKLDFTAKGHLIVGALPVVIQWDNTVGLVYNGKDQQPGCVVENLVKAADEPNLTITLKDESGNTVTEAVNAGTYTATVTAVGNDN